MDDPTSIQLGQQTYELVPQPMGRIARRLGKIRKAFSNPEESSIEALHEAFRVFIPKLAPVYELAGYRSRTDYEELLRHRKAIADARQAAIDKGRLEYAESLGASSYEELDEDARLAFEGVPFDPEAVEPDWQDPYEAYEGSQLEQAEEQTPTMPQIVGAIEAIYSINGGKRLQALLANLGMSPKAIIDELREYLLTRSPSGPSRNGASRSIPSGTTLPTSPPETSPEQLQEPISDSAAPIPSD